MGGGGFSYEHIIVKSFNHIKKVIDDQIKWAFSYRIQNCQILKIILIFSLKYYSNVPKNPALGMEFLRIRQGQSLGFHVFTLLLKLSRESVYIISSGTKFQIIRPYKS